MLSRLLVVCAVAAAPALAQTPEPGAAPHDAAQQGGVAKLLEKADAAYDRRDQPGALDEMRADLEAAEQRAPNDYDVLWRLSRLYFWLADDPAIPDGQKSKLGKKGWEYGDEAIAADPARVEGYHFAAAGMGNYALGIGIFRALREGIEGKFKDRLSKAERIDPDFQGGSIQCAWGRFFYKLPWPKYDAKKSEQSLRAALQKNPDNVRARVYLADLYEKEGQKQTARTELERAAAGEPGRYDAPEERRYQKVARDRLK